MILIGQYDSPFVRRVGMALTLYGMAFDHRPLSVFGDGGAVQALNPLMRVPVLVLEDGTALSDSHMMLDYLDGRVADPMFPRAEPARHRALRVAALACGLADKAVSLFYERRLHSVTSPAWEARCQSQIRATAQVLEAERAALPGPWWFGDALGHADIALACAMRFAVDAHPGLLDPAALPHLFDQSARLESLPALIGIYQPFAAPN